MMPLVGEAKTRRGEDTIPLYDTAPVLSRSVERPSLMNCRGSHVYIFGAYLGDAMRTERLKSGAE